MENLTFPVNQLVNQLGESSYARFCHAVCSEAEKNRFSGSRSAENITALGAELTRILDTNPLFKTKEDTERRLSTLFGDYATRMGNRAFQAFIALVSPVVKTEYTADQFLKTQGSDIIEAMKVRNVWSFSDSADLVKGVTNGVISSGVNKQVFIDAKSKIEQLQTILSLQNMDATYNLNEYGPMAAFGSYL